MQSKSTTTALANSPEFDQEHEPSISAIFVVSADGIAQRRSLPADPYIYHHKWLFVDDSYQGFNVDESKARSEQWIGLAGVDRSRIGRKSFWEEHVVPRLSISRPEIWLKSAEIRKALKLSTCDLAHLRDAGKIESKKVGNAFLYKLPS